MAPSAPEAPSTWELDEAKRHLDFRGYNSKPGRFSEPFPGLEPTHVQRQQYANAFLRWYFGDTQFDLFHIQLAQTADADVVDRFVEFGLEPVSNSAFEYLVDQTFWELHFCWLPETMRPPWPWKDDSISDDDTPSDRFSWFKSEWNGKRSLRPPETRHETAFPPSAMVELFEKNSKKPLEPQSTALSVGSLVSDEMSLLGPSNEDVYFLYGYQNVDAFSDFNSKGLGQDPPATHKTDSEGKVFPVAPPRPRSEDILWKIRYPTQKPPYGTAFLLEIPKHLDFWTYVWGQGGEDWAQITDNYVDDRVNLAWGYRHREQHPDGERRRLKFQRSDLPEEDMFLMIGFRDASLSDPRTLSPARQYLITKLWKIINDWKNNCLLGKCTTLINCLQHMHEGGCTIQETLPDSTFTFASSVLQIENASDRKSAISSVDDILDFMIQQEMDPDDFGLHLQEWVFSRNNLGLNLEERIYLVANIWRQRVPRGKFRQLVYIQTWVTNTRKMMQSEIYSTLR